MTTRCKYEHLIDLEGNEDDNERAIHMLLKINMQSLEILKLENKIILLEAKNKEREEEVDEYSCCLCGIKIKRGIYFYGDGLICMKCFYDDEV